MNRRSFLAGAGGALATALGSASAGCLDRSGVVGASVQHVEPRRLRRSRATIVGFDGDDGAVRVTGFMYYGSSSCNEVGIADVTYEQAAGHLRLALASVDDDPIGMGCTADMAATWYRATVRFADALPDRVTVVESGSGEASTTRTVDRDEQRARCTADHPEGSEAARTAHWTCPERYVAAENSTGETTPADD